jgi:alpha-mannosidase
MKPFHRRTPSFMALFACCVLLILVQSPVLAGFKESVERTLQVAKVFETFQEGFAGPLKGETIQYPRMRSDLTTAMITRASDGTKVIEWTTAPAKEPAGDGMYKFVVRAGIFGQEDPGKRFRLSLDGKELLTFQASNRERWRITTAQGAVLTFESVLRDQFGDLFGYLGLSLPPSLVAAGEPVRLEIAGDRQNSSAWVMIYEDPTALDYLREQAREQAWCDVELAPTPDGGQVRCTATSSWVGRTISWRIGPDTGSGMFAEAGGVARLLASRQSRAGDSLTFVAGTDTLFDTVLQRDSVNESTIYPKRLVSRRSWWAEGTWHLAFESIFMPGFGGSLVGLSDQTQGKGTESLIMSSHQDIAWMDTPEQCIKDRDEKVITPALSLLRDDPRFCFDLEDVLELREYLARHPDRKYELASYIRQGRLGVGASFNMPYEDLCSGEMLVREFYAGLRWLRKNLPGCDSRTVWNVDVPGRSLQSLQVMHKAGVRYLLISRQKPGVYDWRSPDGSSVLVFSPGHYALFNERTAGKPFPDAAAYLASFTREWVGAIDPHTATIPVLSMSDMSAPVRYDSFIDTWNGLHSLTTAEGRMRSLTLPPLRYSTADAFFAAVEKEAEPRDTLRGERPNIWLYIHGPTHHRAIAAKREADVYLPAAEILSTIDGLVHRTFALYPQAELTAAWEAQLYPDHGWGGKNGEVTDSTFRAKYEYARDVAKNIATRAAVDIASQVKTPAAKGTPLMVFNALSWKRSAPVECTATFPAGKFFHGFTLRNADGRSLPFQLLSVRRNPDRSLDSVRIVFIAEGVPSVGYQTYYLYPGTKRLTSAARNGAAPSELVSNSYRVVLAPGGIRQLYDKDLHKQLLDTKTFYGGELFTMQSVGEGAGEWSMPQQPTMEGFDRMSEHNPSWRLVESGPVRQVVEYEQAINHVTVKQRIVLYRALKQLDVETYLLRWDGTKYREFRLAFPVAMVNGQVSYEVPFGTVEVGNDELHGAPGERYTEDARTIRPRSIQHWIDVSDGTAGLTISSSVAVWDYKDPTGRSFAGPLLQPVLLASRKSCHWEGNWYLQKGDHAFRFSLSSHAPGWRHGRQFGVGANTPLIVVTEPLAEPHKTLPESRSFVSFNVPNVTLSTLKKAEDGHLVVLRVFESAGHPCAARIQLPWELRDAEQTNIIEEGGSKVPLEGGNFTIHLGQNAVETYKLTFRE